MAKKIKQLSINLINKIAAGEVIERPFSVVKELVENSIDAGASKISIDIYNECRNIRVADNGSGINPEDIETAFLKHATSKIENDEDLFDINTLGFRGEALSSIISVAKVTCTTRVKDFENGVRVEAADSEVKSVKTGCAIGTIFEVRDLFYNIPARLKFLKSTKTEFSYIQEFVQAIALAYPDIAFELRNNDKTNLKTKGLNNLLTTIKEIHSFEVAENLKEVLKTDKLADLKISGYVSTPNFTRSSKKNYYIYINSRAVKCPVFQKAVDTAYKNMLSNAKYPFVILNLEISPKDIDVNVHPSKKEVRYKNANQIFGFIVSSINFALSNHTEIQTRQENIIDFLPQQEKQEYDKVYISDVPLLKEVYIKSNEELAQNPLKTTENITQQKMMMPMENLEFDENIIGQYKKTYILIEKSEGLEIVDQHIADERYIYEKLKSQKEPVSQLLFISDILTVSPSETELLKETKNKFEQFGYELEFLNETELIFKKVPQLLTKVNPKEILTVILEDLSGNIDGLEEKILITTACKAAIKANQILSMWQMQELIKKWRKCEKPYTCPHGRPISKIIPHKEIAKFFERNN